MQALVACIRLRTRPSLEPLFDAEVMEPVRRDEGGDFSVSPEIVVRRITELPARAHRQQLARADADDERSGHAGAEAVFAPQHGKALVDHPPTVAHGAARSARNPESAEAVCVSAFAMPSGVPR